MGTITNTQHALSGTINKSGRSASGSVSEVDLIAAVTVGAADEHHLTDMSFAVAKTAEGTIFRIYARASSADAWTQIADLECPDYGTYSRTYGTSKKIAAGGQWKVTGQQSTAARMAIEVHGLARISDVKDF